MASAVKVAIRVRPLDGTDTSCVVTHPNTDQVSISNGKSEELFAFDHVMGERIKQHMLYSLIGEDIVEGCLKGYNGTIFAYGQTGSGKTYTMSGLSTEGDDRGLTPRAFEHLFSKMRRLEEECINGRLEYLCKASFMEIYNENILDLLVAKKPSGVNHCIREDLKRGVYVEHLHEESCDTAAACNRLLQKGLESRQTAETQMNQQSSRSHAVFCLHIESRHTSSEGLVNTRRARLNLIDLAGSERQKSAGSGGKQLKEGCHINKSLSALGSVINALVEVSQGRARHIPFRDSKLTFLLKDSLGGNSRTTVIATIDPSSSSFGESLTTLKFAQRAKRVQNQPVVNEDMSSDVQALKAEIVRLRAQLLTPPFANGRISRDPRRRVKPRITVPVYANLQRRGFAPRKGPGGGGPLFG